MNAENYEIKLSKIYPEVKNGQFKVELLFNKDSLSKDVKRGMSLKTKVFLIRKNKSIISI